MADGRYDVVVIGGGPGGYVAAIRAAQLGLSVACVEKRGALGGTCLNVGCIPSKALLQSSHHYEMAGEGLARHGVKVAGIDLDLPAMMARKDEVVHGLTRGIEGLFKKNKVDYLVGSGSLKSADTVEVTPVDGGEPKTLHAENVVIATGSDVVRLPGVDIDEDRIVSSTGALALGAVPKHLVVIGGGYIGLEMGTVWRRLGANVTVVEFLDQVLAGMDGDVSKQMLRVLKKQGLNFRLGTKVTGAERTDDGVRLSLEPVNGGDGETLEADVVLVSVGRRPYTDGLGLDELGVKRDNRGFITVDREYQTNVAGVFAIGDVIGGKMLAHKAEEEGVAVAELIAGQSGHVNYEAVPGVVYTWPEVASVGRTEEQLKEEGIEYRVGRFPFTANARARCNDDTEGFVKILADAATDRLLGAHIIGPEAGDLIQELVVAMEFGGSAEDVARSSHGHPGLSEAVKEAALAVAGRAIHI
ncbi:MAG: dihydrolipoyl dehydrogenase [Rhodospirillales bacterium]|nr:MAG: dihydrolipoyl dehydrogenase [Rhodospirillales bacterium]